MDFNKLLLAFFGLVLSVNLSAQNLAFSRVIDTILIVQTGPEPVDISTKFIGETLSPEDGKVFKVNNMYFQKLHSISNTSNPNSFECDDPTEEQAGQLISGIDISDGEKEFVLFKEQVSNGYVIPVGVMNQHDGIFPLWINSHSTIRTYAWQGQYQTPNSSICIKNYMAKAYISLIEFHTEAQ